MKEVNIVLFGIGNVGKTLIGQLLAATEQWQNEGVKLRIPVIANSTTALFAAEGISAEWNEDFGKNGKSYKVEDIVEFVSQKRLKNLIAVDATASKEFVENYIDLVREQISPDRGKQDRQHPFSRFLQPTSAGTSEERTAIFI